MRSARTLALVATASAIYACSSSSTKRSAPLEDAGPDAALPLEDSGSPGSGGKPAVEAGAGGAIGTGGAPLVEASVPDATAMDAAPDVMDAGPPPFVCRAPDPGDGGLLPDGGPRNRGEWRDFATHQCAACPAPGPACDTFDEPGSTYDGGTRTLTLVMNPSIAEIASGSVTLNFDAILPDGGFRSEPIEAVPVTANGNVLTVDLAGRVPPGVIAIWNITLTLTDTCGTTTESSFGVLYDQADAANVYVNLHCEN